MTSFQHKAVLLDEVIELMNIQPDGKYVDATFGRGGHSRAILAKLGAKGRLLVIDQDEQAIAEATALANSDERVVVGHVRFDELEKLVDDLQWTEQVQGVLMDLGVSSPQLDDPSRGFSFLREGPLDMRMDPRQSLSAEKWVNTAKESEIARVLKEYGEERFARRIAKAICRERAVHPISKTTQLAKIVADANPRWERRIHPATRSFQAIRIQVNDELGALHRALDQTLNVLAVGGRMLVISFHSLEDRLVKRFIQQQERGDDIPFDIPLRHDQLNIRMKRVGKPVHATDAEIESNTRSRSAVLRVAEKLK